MTQRLISPTVYFFFILAGLVAASLLPTSPVLAGNDDFVSAGPYKVRVEVDPETPRVGRNHLTLWLLDENDQPLSGATLKAVAVMPAMGSMPAMYAPAEMIETAPGRYEGEFEPSMAGEWPLTIEITTPAGSGEIRFDLATGRKGLRCSTCGTRAASPGTIHVDPARRQLIGITSGRVLRQDLRITIRATGSVNYDETRLHDVALKFNGWIGRLYANAIGKPVKKGQPMFTVYSPQLLAAQEEYLETLRRLRSRNAKANHLLAAAQRRLRLWDITPQQIKALEKRGKALEYVPIVAPTDGVIVNKAIVAGSAFKAGQRLLRLADLSRVWVEAQVYDYELPLIRPGMPARVVLPDLEDREYPGRVDFIYPFMENDTRSARVRVVLDNRDGFLRPDMYAHIHLVADLGPRLLVPESAVLYTGQSRVVFLDLGEGKLAPRKIKTGRRNRDWIEVLEGLQEGDKVITSGNFLIAAESKLKAGVEQW
ncbi:MAG TPA: efflux RND transporter periplasmic adaptor subunit [Gammaproteobacteria bacterium]|nr:efflux RND transporter periplasmic adaptor subunit [Gammaproteobacteria bacterium]